MLCADLCAVSIFFIIIFFFLTYNTACYMLVIKVQFENHRSGRTLSGVYPSCFLFFSKSALSMSSRSDTWFRRLFWFELPYSVCKEHASKGRWIAKYWWDTEKAMQAMMESRIKRRAKWASHKPSFASSLLHSYSTALLSFSPHSLSLVQMHSAFIELVYFMGGVGVF